MIYFGVILSEKDFDVIPLHVYFVQTTIEIKYLLAHKLQIFNFGSDIFTNLWIPNKM